MREALEAAEVAVLAEESRPRSRESLARLAAALDQRATALGQLAGTRGTDDRHGHTGRAIDLAIAADRARARALRRRPAVTR